MKLAREFFARPSLDVAPQLLGKVLVRRVGEDVLRGRIVEVEAYTGASDPGSHAFRGRTPRNSVMFGPPGHLYVYFTYGMHFCCNVVTDPDGTAGAVLLRAVEPLQGQEVMATYRRASRDVDLTNGPAKLCQAFGIGRAENGIDLTESEVWLEDDGFAALNVVTTPRIGLREGVDLPYRFSLDNSPFVSRRIAAVAKPAGDASGRSSA